MSEKQGNGKRFGKPEWQPQVEFFTNLSADGRYVICKTVITAIKPVRYFEKVLEGKSVPSREPSPATEAPKAESAGS